MNYAFLAYLKLNYDEKEPKLVRNLNRARRKLHQSCGDSRTWPTGIKFRFWSLIIMKQYNQEPHLMRSCWKIMGHPII